MRFAFIRAEKASFPVARMCRLFGVTRQGYYAFCRRGGGKRAASDEALRERVSEVFQESRETYGSPRVHQALRHSGVRVGKRRVERSMRELGIAARKPRAFRRTTLAEPSHPKAPNVLNRCFQASRPNEAWVTDITYIRTEAGWCYLAVLIDLYSRGVVGWSVDTEMSVSLPLKALDMALQHRRPHQPLVHHSDRGCQYTSATYRAALAEVGIDVSMSRKGNCWDNAVAESFFATLKAELIYRRPWSGLAELRPALFEYFELFYNRERIHSTLGYRTPAQAEDHFYAARAA